MLPDTEILNMRVAAAAKLWVWALPCLFYFAYLGYMRARCNRHVKLLMLSAVCTYLGYLFVHFDQGHGWGTAIPFGVGSRSDTGRLCPDRALGCPARVRHLRGCGRGAESPDARAVPVDADR